MSGHDDAASDVSALRQRIVNAIILSVSTRARGKRPRKTGNGKRVAKRSVARSVEPKQAGASASPTSASALEPRQERFAQEYLIDLNQTQAAIRAGYSPKSARAIGCENLTKPDIVDRITALMSQRAVRTRVSKDNVLRGIAEMATYDIADAFDEKGAVRKIHDMPPALRNAIAGIEVQELTIGEQAVGVVKKIKLVDRVRTHELLGRHLKLFTDKLEIDDRSGLAEKIQRARARRGV